jgi:hypothetical protein
MKMIESLQKFNLVDLPVIDSDNTVISGHQRLRALQAIGRGEEVIDVRMPNRKLTDKEVKEYNLLANTHFGEFDFEALELDFMDVDFKGLGMEDLKMNFDAFVLGDLEVPDKKEADNTKYNGGETIDNSENSSVDYSSKNKEIDTDAFEDKCKLVFTYSLAEYEMIKTALHEIADTPELALLKLLNLDENES